MAHEGQLLLHYIQRDAQAKINIPRAQLGGYFIYPFPLHVLHTEWRVIKEGGGNAREGAISHSHPQFTPTESRRRCWSHSSTPNQKGS